MASDLSSTTLKQVQACCQVLFDKKAEELTVLRLGEKSTITDYFIIATGTSDPHLRALGASIEQHLKTEKTPVIGVDRGLGTGWVVVDAYDFMVHLFTPEVRDHYKLEKLWKDAERIELDLK